MVDQSFGGRAVPGVQVRVQRGSDQQLADLKRSIAGVKDELRAMSQAAKDAGRAVSGIKATAAVGRSPAARQPREPSVADLDRQIAAQQPRLQAAGARVARVQADAGYRQQRTAQRMQDRNLNAELRKIKEKERSSMLYRGVNAAGWAPGMPSSMYLLQMALGETGLGLSIPLVAAGMGLAGVGAAGLGLNQAMVDQARTGEQVASQVGTVPGFETGGGVTGQLATLASQYHLSGSQPQDIAAGLAAGGLTRDQAMGATDQAFAQAAVLVNTFGMTVKDATDLVSKQYTDLGRSSADVTDMLQNLAQVALGTGLPASGIAAVLAGSPDLAANVGSRDAGAAAAIFRSVYGDNTTATSMADLANIHGTGAYAVAGMLNTNVTSLDQLRSTKAGQGQLVDQLDALARASVAANGPEAGFSAFNARLAGAGGSALSWDAFQRAITAAPNAGALAAAAALTTPPAAPGSAQAGLALTAAGQLAAGATASQPWSVPQMTVNAAQVTLAGIGNQLQDVGAVASGNASATQLASIAQQGGVAGNAALLSQAVAGVPGALGQLLNDIGTGVFGPSDIKGGVGAVASTVEHHLTLDVTIKQAGQIVGTKQVKTPLPHGGQGYDQYAPQRPGQR